MANSDCPVCRTAEIVCTKWTILIVRDLADGQTLASVDDLFDALDAAGSGTLTLGIVRGSDERDVAVTLG